jgi:hypothetical protein
MTTAFVILAILAWKALWVFIGYRIGLRKNRRGWLYGLLGNWMGVAILAGLSERPDVSVEEWHRANPVPKPSWNVIE